MLFLLTRMLFARPLSLPETLDAIENNSIELQISQLKEEKARLETKKMLTKLLPVVQIQGSWLQFDEPLEVQLLGEQSGDVDCSAFEAFGLGDLCAGFSEPMLLREERIFDGTAQVLYPISSLFSIYKGYEISKTMGRLSLVETELTRKKVRLSVIELYMQALTLQQTVQFAKATKVRLEKHLANIDSFVSKGLLNSLDAERMRGAIEEAELAEQEAQDAYALICRQIALIIGRDFTPIPFDFTVPAALPTMVVQNDILEKARLQEKIAGDAHAAAYGQLIPDVALIAATTRTQGQGTLTPTEQNYIGLSFTMNFGWGERWLQTRQSQRELLMAQQALQLQTEALALEQEAAKRGVLRAQKKEQIKIRKQEIAQEAQRQAEAKFAEQLITAVELLDSEADMLKAQLELAQAKANLVQSFAQFQYVAGVVPLVDFRR
ncbi:MAG: TolC family protein [Myxococcota bacterium]|nr:TolC family protein [Myxococcota bacterium]